MPHLLSRIRVCHPTSLFRVQRSCPVGIFRCSHAAPLKGSSRLSPSSRVSKCKVCTPHLLCCTHNSWYWTGHWCNQEFSVISVASLFQRIVYSVYLGPGRPKLPKPIQTWSFRPRPVSGGYGLLCHDFRLYGLSSCLELSGMDEPCDVTTAACHEAPPDEAPA